MTRIPHMEHRRAQRREALEARERRRELLLEDVQALLRDFEGAPEQIGHYLAEAQAHGDLSPEEVHRAVAQIAALAGPELAARAVGADHAALTDRHAARAQQMMDELRATRTDALAADLAGDLGLAASDIDVRADADAARRTDAAGASGLMDQGVVYLHPDRYDPATRGGRELLAHELVHVAQRALPTADPMTPSRPETEARHMAQAFGAGDRLARPTQALAPHAKAADIGEIETNDEEQRAQIRAAFAAARKCVQAAVEVLSGAEQLDYKMWFDLHYDPTNEASQARFDLVRARYFQLLSFMDTRAHELTIDANETDGAGYYGWIYFSDGEIRVYLGDLFWANPGARAGTIVHELAHDVVGIPKETDGHSDYGEEVARTYAQTLPTKAVENADNYAYFADYALFARQDAAETDGAAPRPIDGSYNSSWGRVTLRTVGQPSPAGDVAVQGAYENGGTLFDAAYHGAERKLTFSWRDATYTAGGKGYFIFSADGQKLEGEFWNGMGGEGSAAKHPWSLNRVMLKADGAATATTEAEVQQRAAEGVAGSGGKLPFLQRIQAAFGRHDVSGVEAHTGAGAAAASRDIGARAYAMGDDVAFAGSPDLHTTAHEAAHVVQQRAGVSLKGGVGEAGDRYEQHADAVADLVVTGQSAEGLLDQMAGGDAHATVQRQEAPGKGQDDLAEGEGQQGNGIVGALYDPTKNSDVTFDGPVETWIDASILLSDLAHILFRVREFTVREAGGKAFDERAVQLATGSIAPAHLMDVAERWATIEGDIDVAGWDKCERYGKETQAFLLTYKASRQKSAQVSLDAKRLDFLDASINETIPLGRVGGIHQIDAMLLGGLVRRVQGRMDSDNLLKERCDRLASEGEGLFAAARGLDPEVFTPKWLANQAASWVASLNAWDGSDALDKGLTQVEFVEIVVPDHAVGGPKDVSFTGPLDLTTNRSALSGVSELMAYLHAYRMHYLPEARERTYDEKDWFTVQSVRGLFVQLVERGDGLCSDLVNDHGAGDHLVAATDIKCVETFTQDLTRWFKNNHFGPRGLLGLRNSDEKVNAEIIDELKAAAKEAEETAANHMRKAFKSGNQAQMKHASKVYKNLGKVVKGLGKINKMGKIKNPMLGPVGDLLTLGKIYADFQASRQSSEGTPVEGLDYMIAMFEGVGFAGKKLKLNKTAVGLVFVYIDRYIIPCLKFIRAHIGRLSEVFVDQNDEWVALGMQPLRFGAEMGGKGMWDFVQQVVDNPTKEWVFFEVDDMHLFTDAVKKDLLAWSPRFKAAGIAAPPAPRRNGGNLYNWVVENIKIISSCLYGARFVKQGKFQGDSPVQRDAQGTATVTDVPQRAAEGVAGSGGKLPFLQRIQAAFGRHDVSGVEAHTGAGAAAASRDIGARAYAMGDDVAFAGSPDLHTTAHEAAHVVQQRAGVSLKGGVGQAGDRYEQHADTVADLVVQGKSAESVLDQMAGGGGASAVQSKTVQRKDGEGTKKAPDDRAPYQKVLDSFKDHLQNKLVNTFASLNSRLSRSQWDPTVEAPADVNQWAYDAVLGALKDAAKETGLELLEEPRDAIEKWVKEAFSGADKKAGAAKTPPSGGGDKKGDKKGDKVKFKPILKLDKLGVRLKNKDFELSMTVEADWDVEALAGGELPDLDAWKAKVSLNIKESVAIGVEASQDRLKVNLELTDEQFKMRFGVDRNLVEGSTRYSMGTDFKFSERGQGFVGGYYNHDPRGQDDYGVMAGFQIQFAADGTATVTDIPQRAAEGVAGSGGRLPYYEQVQEAFGRHDISGVQAHTGAGAAAASGDIGARAYAMGDDVAFAGAPDLHTVAHEAAHVIQQRAGVSLKGGVGQAGDRYEQHADTVADLVVQGKSAESVLDQMAGGGGERAVQSKAVQRELKIKSGDYSVGISGDGKTKLGRKQTLWKGEFTVPVGGFLDVGVKCALDDVGVGGYKGQDLIAEHKFKATAAFEVKAGLRNVLTLGLGAKMVGETKTIKAAGSAGGNLSLDALAGSLFAQLFAAAHMGPREFITVEFNFDPRKLATFRVANISRTQDGEWSVSGFEFEPHWPPSLQEKIDKCLEWARWFDESDVEIQERKRIPFGEMQAFMDAIADNMDANDDRAARMLGPTRAQLLKDIRTMLYADAVEHKVNRLADSLPDFTDAQRDMARERAPELVKRIRSVIDPFSRLKVRADRRGREITVRRDEEMLELLRDNLHTWLEAADEEASWTFGQLAHDKVEVAAKRLGVRYE